MLSNMLRPVYSVQQKLCNIQNNNITINIIRSKVIFPASTVKSVDRMKAWHKANKQLFGDLLESNKDKKKRQQLENKSHAKECVIEPGISDSNKKEVIASSNKSQTLKEKKAMWSNVRNSVPFTGSKIWSGNSRSFSTNIKQCATQNTPAVESGAEDRIMQIRPHKNDFSVEYPSVTLILNKTMTEESQKALEKWKRERIAEMGEEQFKQFYLAQMAVGTKFHETLKRYFTQPSSKLSVEKEVEGVWASVSPLLKNISSPKAIESNVVHPGLKYRGIFDAIADYEDKPTLIEWKKSDRPRKAISHTYDNPVQLAAYYGAISHDLNYKHIKVRDALLVIAYTDGSEADSYRLPSDKLRLHWAQWLTRLEHYARIHGTDIAKRLEGGKRLFEEDIGNLQ